LIDSLLLETNEIEKLDGEIWLKESFVVSSLNLSRKNKTKRYFYNNYSSPYRKLFNII